MPDEVAIMACRPADPTPLERAAAEAVGMDINTPYPDSIKDACVGCGRTIFLGPRQAEMRQSLHQGMVIVACFSCTARLARPGQEPGTVTSLDNVHPTDRIQE